MKKYSSGSFVDAAVRVYGSEADTISSFPATIYADGESASAIVYGNMQQTGTPTPSTPIYPTECGELVSNNYTIPFISGGVTTSINLAAVQTTRKIKKLVLTGEEEIKFNAKNDSRERFAVTVPIPITGTSVPDNIISTHLQTLASVSMILLQTGICMRDNAVDVVVAMTFNDVGITRPTDATTIETAVKSYLAAQYANATPVTLWYVLAAESVGILNEPLRKIGDNVDSVSATVPTLATAESITVDTTLKPSAVQLTYTGWHTHSDKKRSGGAWV